MKRISLADYGPVISDKEDGLKIHDLILSELSKGDQVEVDLLAIKSMATYCAKQIFGTLYNELGSSDFYDRILFKNANNDIKTIINIGIQHAISDKE